MMETQKLYEALAKAQGEMQNAILNKVNPHFKSKYADLPTIRDATIPTLAKHGLSVTQFTRIHESNLVLVTRLAHSCGEFVEGEYPLPFQVDKPQAMGSAMTYARRYGLAAMCGIAAEEDDDANAAQDEGKKNGNTRAASGDPRHVTLDQETAISDKIAEVGADKAAFLKFFNIGSIADLPSDQFDRAIAALEKKRKAA
jgi:hypothetical protein